MGIDSKSIPAPSAQPVTVRALPVRAARARTPVSKSIRTSASIARVNPVRPARVTALTGACLLAGGLAPVSASAHGISGRASLPVPAWLFAWVAAIVLVVSFVLLSTMWSHPRLQGRHERRLCTWPESSV
jgi:hypothetical protein